MDKQEVYKGGTLIIILEEIEVEGEPYTFVSGDKVKFAIKPSLKQDKNILYKKVEPNEGTTSIETIFTAEETYENFDVGSNYILQADLINSKGTFPMHLENLHVIGHAIMEGDN